MTTEQKLRLLEQTQKLTEVNKTLFELINEAEEKDANCLVKAIDKILDSANWINKAAQQ